MSIPVMILYIRAGIMRNIVGAQATFTGNNELHLADWLIDTEQLQELGPPQIGDVIVFAGIAYTLTAVANTGCWQWNDQSQKTYCIHTQPAALS